MVVVVDVEVADMVDKELDETKDNENSLLHLRRFWTQSIRVSIQDTRTRMRQRPQRSWTSSR